MTRRCSDPYWRDHLSEFNDSQEPQPEGKLSNCHIEAWRLLRSGEARHMCIRMTEYAKLQSLTRHWAWTPLRLLGIAIQWISWPLTHLGEFLRTGRWYHATWIHDNAAHMEFVPGGEKRNRWFPPLLFRGAVRPLANANKKDL